MKLSILIPVYNEQNTLALVLDKVFSVDLPVGLEREVIVIDDGSTDQTPEVLKNYKNHLNLRIRNQPNQGKTAALLNGIAAASGEIILIQDADLEYDPAQYPLLLEPVLKGEAEIVYGSRFMGKIKDMRWVNNLANRISNFTFRLLYHVRLTDINTCYKVFRATAFRGIKIVSKNFAFETEVTVKWVRKGLRIKEIPIDYEARSHSQGKKISWMTALEMYWPIIKYRFLNE